MESLKKIISLSQGAAISGYSQDYLGYLIRQGEIKGVKKGRSWFTTEEEINNYLFKKKVRNRELAVREFFSVRRKRNILLISLLIFLLSFIFINFVSQEIKSPVNEVQSAISSDGEAVIINN